MMLLQSLTLLRDLRFAMKRNDWGSTSECIQKIDTFIGPVRTNSLFRGSVHWTSSFVYLSWVRKEVLGNVGACGAERILH